MGSWLSRYLLGCFYMNILHFTEFTLLREKLSYLLSFNFKYLCPTRISTNRTEIGLEKYKRISVKYVELCKRNSKLYVRNDPRRMGTVQK